MAFLTHFLAYFILMLVIIAVAAVAVFIGITARKKKDAKEALSVVTEE